MIVSANAGSARNSRDNKIESAGLLMTIPSACLIFGMNIQSVKEKRINVGGQFDGFGCAAGAVARLRFDANQHGIVFTRQRLKCSRVLEGVRRHNTVVMVRCSDEGGRV